jgi:putative transposase
MTDYRRAQFAGGYYFFTVVTLGRRRFLTDDLARHCLRLAWRDTRQKQPFEVLALCLLPEHLHCIWRLPEADRDFSGRWSRIKTGFTHRYLAEGGQEFAQAQSRLDRRERGIWQRRFWEHQIRDESDLQRHVDYIHYNPVKHGLVEGVEDWPWSTYHRYVREGTCHSPDWTDIQEKIGDLVVGE